MSLKRVGMINVVLTVASATNLKVYSGGFGLDSEVGVVGQLSIGQPYYPDKPTPYFMGSIIGDSYTKTSANLRAFGTYGTPENRVEAEVAVIVNKNDITVQIATHEGVVLDYKKVPYTGRFLIYPEVVVPTT